MGRPRRKHTTVRLSFFVLGLLSISISIQPAVSLESSPPITVSLQASWPAPPQILEILETAAAENETAYFPFLDDIVNQIDLASDWTSSQLYKKTLEILESHHLRSPAALSLYKWSLSLHNQAPKIQAYYHYYNNTVLPSFANSSISTGFDENCEIWADWYGRQICRIEEIEKAVADGHDGTHSIKLLSFDRVYRHASHKTIASLPSIILYADIQSPSFKRYHQGLLGLAKNFKFQYIIRHKPPLSSTEDLLLSGYGVELALKKTDYIVIDDRNVEKDDSTTDIPVHGSESPMEGSSTDDNDPLSMYTSDIKPLKLGEIADISAITAEFIANSTDPLSMLMRVSQDFPRHASYLSKLSVSKEFRKEISEIQHDHIAPGANAIWLNGLPLQDDQISPFVLLRLLRRERELIDSLKALGLTTKQAVDLISSPSIGEAQTSTDTTEGLFDMRDTIEDGKALIWLNDIEKDSRYKGWSANLYELMRGVYPGQMHAIRRNLYNTVFVIDFTSEQGLKTVVGDMIMFIRRQIPIRFGVVPVTLSPDSKAMAKLFYYLVDTYGLTGVHDFLNEVFTIFSNGLKFDLDHARIAFEKVLTSKTPKKDRVVLNFDEVIGTESPYNDRVAAAEAYTKRLGVIKGGFFVNGRFKVFDETYQRSMIETIHEHMTFLQNAVHEAEIKNEASVLDFFLDRDTTYKRRNPYVFVDNPSSVNFIQTSRLPAGLPMIKSPILDNAAQGNVSFAPLDMYIIGDFDTLSGVHLLKSSLDFLQTAINVRLRFVHIPGPVKVSLGTSGVPTLLHLYGKNVNDFETFKNVLSKALDEFKPREEQFKIQDGGNSDADIAGIKESSWSVSDSSIAAEYWNRVAVEFTTQLPKVAKGDHIIINGRLIGPILDGDFSKDDFDLLASYERQKRAEPVLQALKALNATPTKDVLVDLFPQIVSAIALVYKSDSPESIFDSKQVMRYRAYDDIPANRSVFRFGTKSEAYAVIGAVIDPVSISSQKWSTIFKVLAEMEGVYLQIHLNPAAHLSELPLKRFYRYSLRSSIEYDSNGKQIPPQIKLTQIPADTLLTLELDVPQPWLVTPKKSVHDLDNIRLASLGQRHRQTGVDALFQLDSILVEGHARNSGSGAPPRGLQLVLATANSPLIADTIVMANLGYLQLKANPGVFKLALREGKSTEIYEMESIGNEGWNSAPIEEAGDDVLVTSFEGTMIYPRMKKRPGKENEQILDEAATEDHKENLFDKIKSFSPFGGGSKQVQKPEHAKINIFSVASGHLYERFIYIMIISVLRHTNSSVKFWFIENFLSPSFKEFIGHMASKYGFEYELVTYKWPSWLRGQTEKQRKIWGYKILFLDVLFPLSLDKVIFVDADQIVRTDLQELVDMDLQGAPYGYTPMCDTREDMDNFRFWKQGFWKNYLQGKPYHISALYVVDLRRFRQMAAGDQLRQQYQSLSADPNSLANLDQDLPNSMQPMVKIFSLPQDWLWCETWCSDEALKTAKTIDLCNNPKTHEPKLARARRQVPEWEIYDNEVSNFANHLSENLKVAPLSEEGKVDISVVPPNDVQVVPEPEQERPPTSPIERPSEKPVKDEL